MTCQPGKFSPAGQLDWHARSPVYGATRKQWRLLKETIKKLESSAKAFSWYSLLARGTIAFSLPLFLNVIATAIQLYCYPTNRGVLVTMVISTVLLAGVLLFFWLTRHTTKDVRAAVLTTAEQATSIMSIIEDHSIMPSKE